MRLIIFIALLTACAKPNPIRIPEINPRENDERWEAPTPINYDEFGEEALPPKPKKKVKQK